MTRARSVAGALAVVAAAAGVARAQERPRAREMGVEVGVLPPGRLNAITDVPGVLVGHVTLIEGDSIRTGVTAIRPHPGDVFTEKVPAAIHVANGFGKLTGISQVRELGNIETPIVLTNTLAVGRAADAVVRWTLDHTGTPRVRSVNPVVGETNDAGLNAITVPRIGAREVVAAIDGASGGPVAEGSVGAGTGTRALGFKGGIGTASRRVRIGDRVHVLGVLVQSNFGGALEILGVPVGRRLGAAAFLDAWNPEEPVIEPGGAPPASGGDRDGSIMIVVATDAPVDARGLERIASRAPYAIGRVGGHSSHGSGDYVIAFSTAEGLRAAGGADEAVLREEGLNPLFRAVIEATEEAILNSLFRATPVTGPRGTAEAVPIDEVRELLRRTHALEGMP